MRSINGQERMKIFEQIDFLTLIPNLENVLTVQKLWRGFLQIYVSIKNGNFANRKANSSDVKVLTQEWLKLYLTIYRPETVTPYMHTLVEHVPQMMELHGNIDLYTMQGNFI
jgi:hypothetical protein